jgi:hypothetical protein
MLKAERKLATDPHGHTQTKELIADSSWLIAIGAERSKVKAQS